MLRLKSEIFSQVEVRVKSFLGLVFVLFRSGFGLSLVLVWSGFGLWLSALLMPCSSCTLHHAMHSAFGQWL